LGRLLLDTGIHVAEIQAQHVAGNKQHIAGQHVACCRQHVARPRPLLWCKRGLTVIHATYCEQHFPLR